MGRRGLLAILFRLIRLRCPVPELATRLPSRARSGRRPRRRSRPGCRRVAVQHSGQRAEPTASRHSLVGSGVTDAGVAALTPILVAASARSAAGGASRRCPHFFYG